MAYSFKGSISFGLVYIPIKLEAAVSPDEISFNQLEKNTMSRVRYQKTCDGCEGKVINQNEVVKAYQYEKDRYVVFNDEDFEKIKSKKDKTILIERFVELDEIDPIFYDKPYYVIPSGGEKAFYLLQTALQKENKVGLAKTVLGAKECVVALRISGGQMLLNTLYFKDEIKKNPAKDIKEDISDEEQEMAQMIIKNMTKPFEPSKYKNEYNQKVRAAVEAKVAGKEITAAAPEETEKAISLMDALRASLKNSLEGAGSGIIAPSSKTKTTSVKPKKQGIVAKSNS